MAMLAFQVLQPLPCLMCRQLAERAQVVIEALLLLAVELRPYGHLVRLGEQAEIRRREMSQLLDQLWVAARSLSETRPDCFPVALALGKALQGIQHALFLRVNAIARVAHLAEGLPFMLRPAGAHGVGVVEPIQQVTHRIAPGEKNIEGLGIQVAALKISERLP